MDDSILPLLNAMEKNPPTFEEFDMQEFREDFAGGYDGLVQEADTPDEILDDPDILLEVLIQEYSNFHENIDRLESKGVQPSQLIVYYERPTLDHYRDLFNRLYGERNMAKFQTPNERIQSQVRDVLKGEG